VTPAQALEAAYQAGASNRFSVTIHLCEHRDTRNIHRADIREALRTASTARKQENERWRLEGGHDLDGDDLTLIVVFEADVVVITAF
jgi:hypothetical protein